MTIHILLFTERSGKPVSVMHFDDLDDLIAQLRYMLDNDAIAYYRIESVGYFDD